MLQLLMEKQLAEIIFKLDENNIDNAVLKGAPLDRKIYGNQTKRVYKDIDILINYSQLNNANENLLSLGFKIKENSRYNLDFFERYPLTKKGLKDITYIHQESSTILELHWRISMINDLDITLDNDFFNSVRCGVQDYLVLKNEYELLYLIHHGAMSGWHRLKWLIDIVDYLDAVNIDRAVFKKLVMTTKSHKFIKDLQEVVKQYFQIELPLPDVPDYKMFKSFRHNYIFDKNYYSDLSIKQLSVRDLLYCFIVSSKKFRYLQTYVIGYFYKRKAIYDATKQTIIKFKVNNADTPTKT